MTVLINISQLFTGDVVRIPGAEKAFRAVRLPASYPHYAVLLTDVDDPKRKIRRLDLFREDTEFDPEPQFVFELLSRCTENLGRGDVVVDSLSECRPVCKVIKVDEGMFADFWTLTLVPLDGSGTYERAGVDPHRVFPVASLPRKFRAA